MHKIILLFSLLAFSYSQQAEITNIQAAQRTDGSQIVDITYDLLPDPVFEFFEITVKVSLNGGINYGSMVNVTGDLGDIIEAGTGKMLTWNFGQQFGGTYSDQIKIKIEASSFAIVDNNNNQELPFEMVSVSAGEYTFGENDEIRTIDYDYEIMKYPVTDMDYVLFMMDELTESADGDGGCSDVDDGANDSYGDDCTDYTLYPSWCGGYDDDDFDSMAMCCACGGGFLGYYSLILTSSFVGYYPGDANYPAGHYNYINFNDSKISWNDEIFEVEEGNVNHPVTGVTWFGAWAFALHYGMEVPDQYEWEKAARGNTGYDYPWGNEFIGNATNCNSSNLPFISTTPVNFFNGEVYEISGGDQTVSLEFTPGNYCSEVMWRIKNSDGQIVQSSNYGCDDISFTLPVGSYSLELADSYGDGWNGTSLFFTAGFFSFSTEGPSDTCGGNDFCISYAFELLESTDTIELQTINGISPFGSYDMAGNTWEIVKNNDDSYLIKGGAYNSVSNDLKSWNHQSYTATTTSTAIGFRCLRVTNQPRSNKSSRKIKSKHHSLDRQKYIDKSLKNK